MNNRRDPQGTARKFAAWFSIGAALFVGGTAYFTATPMLWVLAGLSLTSGLALLSAGRSS